MKRVSFLICGSVAFFLVLVFLFPNAGAAAEQGSPKAPKEAIESHMEQCTAKHGYDPEKMQGLGEHELGAGEEEWRACVYEGIRTLIAPTSAVPKMYAELIDQDRRLTAAIKKGEMTRSGRKQKNVALIEEIGRQEEARKAEQLRQKQKEMDEAMRKKAELDMRMRGSKMQAQDSLMRGMGR